MSLVSGHRTASTSVGRRTLFLIFASRAIRDTGIRGDQISHYTKYCFWPKKCWREIIPFDKML